VEGRQQVPRYLGDPADLVDEVHVPGGPAELTVGRGLKAHLPLERDGLADLDILDRRKLRGGDHPCGQVVPRVLQPRGPQQAPDVIGTERRRCPR